MQNTIILPSVITTLRVAAIPFIVFFLNSGNYTLFWSLFLLSLFTDLIDGYIARKFRTTSRVGAYYDVVADFGLILGVFTIFTVKGIYPSWILAIIIISFALFLITSLYGTQIYDPIGRYWGVLLYGTIAITVLVQTKSLNFVMQLIILGFFIASLVTRISWFTRSLINKNGNL